MSRRIFYSFRNADEVDQSENVFDQKYAEAYAAGLNDVNQLRKMRDRGLTPKEVKTERKRYRS